jgi:hypothetical protein
MPVSFIFALSVVFDDSISDVSNLIYFTTITGQ